ncbi:hypothetical protein HYPSUDRAFT_186977 [Hypholoma sublateritium FD-334 SS-4]|uniref:Uncharacterized protein n=1 Tax=Hypholoma sublateritium (strain FD-334 SS-4) TaxID=945553 RepID=A0A0D2NZA2_HYPSF|nr:hypothetical protein HYPSUDRAFT_186977 [Hypholoma sublateritium FD-334 SS-4]
MKSSITTGSGARRTIPAQASSSTSRSASTKASPLTSTSPESLKDAEMYHRLLALGMPTAITLADFMRMLNRATSAPSASGKTAKSVRTPADRKSGGQIRSALELLSIHLVGRDEARRLRCYIASARAAHEQAKESISKPTSRIRAPAVHAAKGVDVLDDPRAAAAARRDMAYRNLESVRREHGVEAERHRVLDKQRRDLADELDERRHVELLLRILEKRETVRLSRIGMGDDGGRKGLGTLLDLLRKESALATRQWCSLLRENPSNESSNQRRAVSVRTPTRKNGPKYKHTTEALAVCDLFPCPIPPS